MRLISGAMHSILPPEMRASTRTGLAALLLSVSACKRAGTRAEAPEANLDDIAAIEAELSANEARLQAQGLDTSTAAAQQTGVDMADDDDAAAGGAPVVPAPEPTPADEVSAEEADEAPAAPTMVEREEASSRKSRKRDAAPSRCDRICDLAENTCVLAERICGLADDHVDDVRYEEACERAQAQCELASEACSACEE